VFELIDGFDEGTVAVRGVGMVTATDYKTVLAPAIERATADGRKARLLLELGSRFEGYDSSAMLADSTLGIGHFASFDRIAIVTDAEWVRRAIQLFGGLIPGEVRLFENAESDDAQAWMRER
jgi:hypothetical protein